MVNSECRWMKRWYKSRKVRLSPGKWKAHPANDNQNHSVFRRMTQVRTCQNKLWKWHEIFRYSKPVQIANNTHAHACNLWFGCSYQCNSKQNQGPLNQDHKFWNKSLAVQEYLSVCAQKTALCLAPHWQSLQRPGIWQEQCDSCSLCSGWGLQI